MLFGFDVDAAFAEMNALGRQLNRGLDARQALRPTDAGLAGTVDDNGALVWTADLPGVSRDELKVTVENGVLTIDAKRLSTTLEGRIVRHSERRGFEVQRSFELPETVDVEGITASLEHGVLQLRLPRKPEAQPRSIEIRVN